MSENAPESLRSEIFRDVSENAFEVIERKAGLWEKLYGNTALRKAVLLVFLAVLWVSMRDGSVSRFCFQH